MCTGIALQNISKSFVFNHERKLKTETSIPEAQLSPYMSSKFRHQDNLLPTLSSYTPEKPLDYGRRYSVTSNEDKTNAARQISIITKRLVSNVYRLKTIHNKP
jgi:hypothetical protein